MRPEVLLTLIFILAPGLGNSTDGGNKDEKRPADSAIEQLKSLDPSLIENIRKANEAARRGSELIADGFIADAINQYQAALDILPSLPVTKALRDSYEMQMARAEVVFAEEEARLKFYVVEKGGTLADVAGKFNVGIKELRELNSLPADAEPAAGELLLLPPQSLESRAATRATEEFLKATILPTLVLDDVLFIEAVATLRAQLLQHGHQLNPRVILSDPGKYAEVKVTLRLSNVPAAEAFRYLTKYGQSRYRIRGGRIDIESLAE